MLIIALRALELQPKMVGLAFTVMSTHLKINFKELLGKGRNENGDIRLYLFTNSDPVTMPLP